MCFGFVALKICEYRKVFKDFKRKSFQNLSRAQPILKGNLVENLSPLSSRDPESPESPNLKPEAAQFY